jgi:hypothetical protein
VIVHPSLVHPIRLFPSVRAMTHRFARSLLGVIDAVEDPCAGETDDDGKKKYSCVYGVVNACTLVSVK